MKKPKSLLPPKVLFTPLLPLIVAGTFYALATVTGGLKTFLFRHDSLPLSHLGSSPHFEKIESLFEWMRALSLSIYDSYFHFMIVMGIINLIWKIITSPRIIRDFSNQGQSKGHLQGLIAKFISFSLIYLLLVQIMVFTSQSDYLRSDSNLSHSKPNIATQDFSQRVLEQQEGMLSTPQIPTPEKLSLSIGRVLGALDLDLASFVLSKDSNYVFALARRLWVLKVVDISDLEDPFVKTSLEFNIDHWFFGQKNLILSPDGNMLYISDFKNLQIVNVTDPLLPNALGFCQEKSLSDLPSVYISSTGQPRTTLALSKDNKRLFIGGFGLQVFDVSVEIKPPEAIFKNIHNCNNDKCMNTTTITLSADGQSLFLANGTLDIYQISSTGKLPQLISSYESKSLLTSIFLFDDKTAYIAGTENRSQVTIEKVDISDLRAPKRLNLTPFPLTQETFRPAYIVATSPNKTQLFVLVDANVQEYFAGPYVLVYDITKDFLINDEQSLLTNAFSIIISADGTKVFASSNSKFLILELFLDYPNKRIMSLSQDVLDYFKTESYWIKTIPSLDNKILFVNAQDLDEKDSWFEIWNLTVKYSPTLIASYKELAPINFMTITADYTKAFFYCVDNKLTVLDITNLTNPTPYSSYTFGDDIDIQSLQISKDGYRVFAYFQTSSEANYSLAILDFSDVTSIKQISTIQALKTPQGSSYNALLLDKDEKTVFIVYQSIEIYDCSDPSNPTFLNSLPVAINEPLIYFYSASLSSDSKTLFVEFYEPNFFRKLRIFNVSAPTSVTLISDTILPMYDIGYLTPFQITPDSKTGYVFERDAMLILSLTDLAAPSVSGVVPLRNSSYTGWAFGASLSFDGKMAFVYNRDREIRVLDLQLKNTLYINQETFSLGKKYSDRVQMLGLNYLGNLYPLDEESFKFLSLGLIDITIVPNMRNGGAQIKYTPLPSWISFDTVNHVLTIDAKKQADLNNYTLYTLSSRNIPEKAFFSLDFVKSQTVLTDLLTVLVSLGYVDNELFLTSQFGLRKSFRLNNEFTPYIDEIYGFLESFLFKTCTTFEVVPSASLLEYEDKFSIMTPSLNNIKVEVKLHPNQRDQETEGQFLFKPYASLIPVITEKKSRLKLEGPLDEVNQALELIVVNYEHNTWCNGEITAVDYVNPPILRIIGNISKYFLRNELPKVNPNVFLSAQEQLEISPIYTGQYFTINLNKSTFKDDHNEDLSYYLMMAKEPHTLPNWLIFEDLTIKGTPPEQVLGRDIELVLAVKNEFKTLEVPLKLHINISSLFTLKLIMQYSPYVLTLLGLLISANKVYNILAQKYYKHRKEFLIEVGEEVTPHMIYPVSFIGDEMIESKLILKEMSKYIAKERGSAGKAEFLSYFMEEQQQLDKQKIVRVVKRVSLEMPQKKLRLYRQASRSFLVNRIIINEITKWHIDSQPEKPTKEIFERMKDRWIDMVDWDIEASGFIINPEKFNKVLDKVVGSSSEDNLERGLMNSVNSNINIAILKDAILAYAFEDHHVDVRPILVKIVIKQKVDDNILFRLFKINLRDAHLHGKNKLGHGIEYKIVGDTLFFCGIADQNLEGKTIVIQITNVRKRILKEIWTHGVSRKSEEMNQIEENNTPYEVF